MMFHREISTIHAYSPYWLLKLWGSSDRLVAFTEKLAYGGDGYKHWHAKLRKMEHWPLEKIEEFQMENLKRLIRHCYNNVPYYGELFKRLGLSPSDINCPRDLERLPVLTKNDILDNYQKFFAKNMVRWGKMTKTTSGTSGTPATFYHDEGSAAVARGSAAYFKQMGGYRERKDDILGMPLFARSFHLPYLKYPIFSHYSPVAKVVYLSVLGLLEDSVFERGIHYIRKYNIQHIEGFPSTVFAFARYLARKNYDIGVRSVHCGGEMLYDFQRSFIEKTLKCKVFEIYMCSEHAVSAGDCEKHAGLHISPFSVVSIDPSGPGIGTGRIVSTSTANYFMPLLRYVTGDVGSITYKRCACGRPFPRLSHIEGRTNEFIILPDGRYIHPNELARYTITIRGIDDIHFFQHEDYSVDISVVKNLGADERSIARGISGRFRKITDNAIPFSVQFKDVIKRKSRKRRVVETMVSSDLNVPRKG